MLTILGRNLVLSIALAAWLFPSQADAKPNAVSKNKITYESAYKKSLELRRSGQILEGRHCLDEYLAIHPEDPKAWAERGFADNDLGDFQACKNDMTKALELPGGKSISVLDAVYVVRGYANSMVGSTKEAYADLAKAMQISPKNGEAYNIRGLIKERTGKLKDALADYERGSTLSPQNETCLVRTIQCAQKLKLKDKVQKWLDKLIEYHPKLEYVKMRMAFNIAEKRWLAANRDARLVLEKEPKNFDIHCVVYDTLVHAGEYGAAEQQLRMTVEMFPDDKQVQIRKADVAFLLGKTNDAASQYKALLKKYPDETHILEQYGLVLRKQQRYEQAVRQFEKAAKIHEVDEGVLLTWADCLRKSQQHPKAAELFTKYYQKTANREILIDAGEMLVANGEYKKALETFKIATNPGGPGKPLDANKLVNLYTYESLAYLRLNRPEDAIKSATLGLKLKPDSFGNLMVRAQAHVQLKHSDYAIKDLTECIRLKPDLAMAYSERAKMYEQKKLHDLARKDRKRLATMSRKVESDLFSTTEN